MKEKCMAYLIIATFLAIGLIALTTNTNVANAYPTPPVIDGVFTGWNSTNEYASAAVDPGAGIYCWYYQMNNGTHLFTMNDFYIDTTNDTGGAGLDYNVFTFDLNNDGVSEWQLNVYANGTVTVLLNDVVVPPAQHATYGIQAATGFGLSPKQNTIPHRMYEISIKHGGIGNLIYTDPNDPTGSVPPSAITDINRPPQTGFTMVEAWGGYVRTQPNGTPIVSYGPQYVVGGVAVSVDKLGLLAPYFGLASTAMIGAVATAVYAKRIKRRKEKQ
jgi:hypothetical protein